MPRLFHTTITLLAAALLIAGCAADPAQPDDRPDEDEAAQPVELVDSDIVPVADSPIRGDENAWVTVVVFADFQCPFSARLAATLDEVQQVYDRDTVRLVFKHYPLADHPGAEPAARATEAARNQGMFWEMHDALFDNLAVLRSPDPTEAAVELAVELGMDEEQLRRDMQSDEVAARVEADRELGEELELDSAPAVFINGGYIPGARPARIYHSAVQNVYEVLRQGVVTGEIERDEIYRSSVETLYDHTRPDEDPRSMGDSVVRLPVDDGPATGDIDAALINIGLFVDLGEASSRQLLRQLNELLDDEQVRLVLFHLFDDADEPARLAHRTLEGAEAPEDVRALVAWLADEANDWRADPQLLEQFAAERGIEPVDSEQFIEAMDDDLEAARDYQVYGTPTMFINGIRFLGIPDDDDLDEVLDEQRLLADRVGEIMDVAGLELYEQMVEGNRQRQE